MILDLILINRHLILALSGIHMPADAVWPVALDMSFLILRTVATCARHTVSFP